ncbi:MAG: DUF1501 domain-containing protein [Methylococcus sp.]
MNRRDFLKHTGFGLTGTALLSTLGGIRLAEAAGNDYKALVCVFLFGGNDSNNMLIPLDAEGYAAYNAVRGPTSGINIPQSSWLPINPSSQGGKVFGLHPSLASLQPLFSQNRLALIANTGTLAKPTTRAQYLLGGAKPDNLFSHVDQQNQWQSATTKAAIRPTGWGGRLADGVATFNAATTFPPLASLSGVNLFTQGAVSSVIAPNASSLKGFNTSAASMARYQAMRQLETLSSGNVLIKAKNSITGKAIDSLDTLTKATASVPALTTVFPGSSLGGQLKNIATMIAARGTLGVQRQVFFCSLGGFDTHSAQLNTQAGLFKDLADSLKAFQDATIELGVDQAVTAFTLSDFGRTFLPSANAGSDHGWGSHHLILGGAVKGGDIYGKYPTLQLAGPDDADSEGRWIPSTSVEEYAYPLVRWFGLSDPKVVLPNLSAFDLTRKDLGFMTGV